MIKTIRPQTLRALDAPLNPDPAAPVTHITMVGALEKGDGLSDSDRGYLSKIFEVCAHKQIPMSPSPVVTVSNLEYSHDFLHDALPSDMVVFSYIFYDPALACVPRMPNFVRQSSLSSNDDAWHRSLEKSGARYAFNIYEGLGENELPTRLIDRSPFRLADRIQAPDIKRNLDLLIR